MASPDGTGPYWGARYTRTWFTTLAGLPLLAGVYFAVIGGSDAWTVLAPVAVVIAVVIWSVPLAVVSTAGIRLVLRREELAWPDVAAVLDPRAGDEEVRIELMNRRVISVPGVPPRAVPALRSLHTANR